MLKSYRDIKSSLDISRERQAISRTAQIESMIVKGIEAKYGNIHDNIFSKDAIFKERVRKQRQIQSLELSRLRLFINKERRSSLQRARLHPFLDPEKPHQDKDAIPEKPSNPTDKASKLRRMEFKY
jgi:hypothetical protein